MSKKTPSFSTKSKVVISVDAAAAFDILSILELKWDSLISSGKESAIRKSLKITDQTLELEESLKKQLGKDLYYIVYTSRQYKNLVKANLNLFNAINDLNSGFDFTAKELDALNYKRFKAKNSLQRKFFGLLEEVKVGYNKA